MHCAKNSTMLVLPQLVGPSNNTAYSLKETICIKVSRCLINIGVNMKFSFPFFSEFFSLSIISLAKFN